MNIFMLDTDPMRAAAYHCDKHVVKMLVEYAQLLSTAHRVIDDIPAGVGPYYKTTHKNHPSAVWVRESKENYEWLVLMWDYLHSEYTKRYNKQHKSFVTLSDALYSPPKAIPRTPSTSLRLAIDDASCVVLGDPVASYRAYYKKHKARIATWKTSVPDWFKE